MTNGKLKNLAIGTVITFAGREYILLGAAGGSDIPFKSKILFLKNPLINRAFNTNGSNAFNLSDGNGIGYYLNKTFYNTFSAAEKSVIKTVRAYYPTYEDENSDSYIDESNIGGEWIDNVSVRLLKYPEWTSQQVVPALSNYNTPFWLFGRVERSGGEHNNVVVANRRGATQVPSGSSFVSATELRNVHPVIEVNEEVEIVNGVVVLNTAPTLTINTPNNQTLYENGIFTIKGNAIDANSGDAVTVKYQINSGTVRNIHSAVSNGSTPIQFAKELKYSEGLLKDGNTPITSVLSKDQPHTLSVWAEDGNGGKSAVITRTFFVVPNRPPVIALNPIQSQIDLINSDVINVSGTVTDADDNNLVVTASINGDEEVEVYSGAPANFLFNVALSSLKVGINTILFKATDTYNTSSMKTLRINKKHDAVPVNKAVAMYKITPPNGKAKSVLLWISRTLGALDIDVEVAFVDSGETENFVEAAKTNTGTTNGLREDEFAYQNGEAKSSIILKVTYNRANEQAIDVIKQIKGVMF